MGLLHTLLELSTSPRQTLRIPSYYYSDVDDYDYDIEYDLLARE